ncbi:MAG: hypothetical protein IJ368_00805 [Oscillospiraceae bacterium]|nr:hypothetical protein [Oscillospiraceae bacterium]
MIKRKIISVMAAAVMSFSAVSALSVSVSAEWIKSESGYSYKSDDTGKKLTGWQTIGDGKYYFDKNGYALTGWKKISGEKYYFNKAKKGRMLTGWATVGESKYYFGTDGKMRTGWKKIGGNTYYFGTNGKMRTGKLKISGKVYDFGTDGIMKGGSASSSSSKSLYGDPMKGLKWSMSMDEVIDSGLFDNYIVLEPMLMVYDDEPYAFYMFDDDNIVTCGFADKYSASVVKNFRAHLKNEGYKLAASEKEDDTNVFVYQKGDLIAAVAYNNETAMLMMFSEELAEEISDGDFSSLDDMM